MEIRNLIPKALGTLARPTKPKPESINRATKWLTSDKFGWGLIGNETREERETLLSALETSVEWLAHFIDGAIDPYWLILVGPSGTGKTMLSKRIAQFVRSNGLEVFNATIKTHDERAIYSYQQEGAVFMPWRDLVPHCAENQGRFERAKRDWFKCIDDLKPQTGQEIEIEGAVGMKPKPFEINAAGDLLDARLRHWTVLTSNLTRSQLAQFWDVRIASRLMRDGNRLCDLSEVRDFGLRKEQFTSQKTKTTK